eukprot:gene1728-453_t
MCGPISCNVEESTPDNSELPLSTTTRCTGSPEVGQVSQRHPPGVFNRRPIQCVKACDSMEETLGTFSRVFIAYQSSCTSQTMPGKYCSWECEPNYIPVQGDSEPRMCDGSSGQFLGTRLVCAPSTCNAFDDTHSTTLLGTLDQARECLPNGRFSGTQLQCRDISCNSHLDLGGTNTRLNSNSAMCGPETKQGTVRECECLPGFDTIAKGPRRLSRRCIETGDWDPFEPLRCVVRTCNAVAETAGRGTQASGATLICNSATDPGTTCEWECMDDLAKVAGDNTRVCLDSGLFSGNHLVNSCNNAFGSPCKLSCIPGYTGAPDPVASCQSDGSWFYTGTGPEWFPLWNVQFYWSLVIRWIMQSSGLWACSASLGGYFGFPGAQCQVSGYWEYTGLCSRVDCGQPLHPSGPFVDASGCSTGYQEQCILTCVNGYTGSPRAVCGPGGDWSYSQNCDLINCNQPIHPSAPHVDVSQICDTHFARDCPLECKPGYEGSPRATCTANSLWAFYGTCQETVCGAIKHPSGSTLDTSECLGTEFVDCGPPQHPDFPVATAQADCSHLWTDSCALSCTSGYSGAPTATCADNSAWVYGGRCHQTDCGIPVHPGGSIKVKEVECNTAFGDVCLLQCSDGFVGSPSAVCLPTGQWAYKGECSAVTCGPPGHLDPNVDESKCQVWEYGTSCNVECYPGYSGTPSSVCLGNGQWSYAGSCNRVQCVSPGHPSAPYVDVLDCSPLQGDRCLLQCVVGSTGSPSAVCQPSGEWLYGGDCDPVGCGPPVHPSRAAEPQQCQTTWGQPCLLTCATGYGGNPTALCQASGEWAYTGTCMVVGCGSPSHPSGQLVDVLACGTSFGQDCNMQCKNGYNGAPTAECGSRGQWIYEGQCNALDCGVPQHPSGDFVSFGTCSYSFGGSGYQGDPAAVCLASGAWSYTGVCLEVNCGPVRHPSTPNLQVIDAACQRSVGSYCFRVCNAGYTGTPGAVCQATGLWDYSGACTEVGCGGPAHPSGAAVSPGGCADNFGSTCILQCPAGTSGYPLSTCLATGQWSYLGTCDQVNCGAVVHPSVTGDGSMWAHVAPLDVVYQSTPLPLSQLQTNGQWTYTGQCLRVSCGPPRHPSSLVEVRSTCIYEYGLGCPVRCTLGATGNPEAICLPDGQWTYTGTCKLLPVGPGPVDHPDGSLVDSSLCQDCSICTLSCIDGFVGSPEAECVTGSWAYSGTCLYATCGPIVPTIPFAVVPASCTITVGSTCNLLCGNSLDGNPVATCTSSLQWIYQGVCASPSCGPLTHSSLPYMDTSGCQSNDFGAICQLACQLGYTGSPDAECGANGQWKNVGQCLPVDCGPVQHPSGALVSVSGCTGSTFGGQCELFCIEGISGNPIAACGHDGTWGYAGICGSGAQVGCGEALHPDTNVSPLDTCELTGQWTHQGSCQVVQCDKPFHADPNAWGPYLPWCNDGYNFGSTCLFGCNDGHVGAPQATCGANSQWVYTGTCRTLGNVVEIINCKAPDLRMGWESCPVDCTGDWTGQPSMHCLPNGNWRASAQVDYLPSGGQAELQTRRDTIWMICGTVAAVVLTLAASLSFCIYRKFRVQRVQTVSEIPHLKPCTFPDASLDERVLTPVVFQSPLPGVNIETMLSPSVPGSMLSPNPLDSLHPPLQ